MKITDVTLTLFAWESIPSTIYGHHTARPSRDGEIDRSNGHRAVGYRRQESRTTDPPADRHLPRQDPRLCELRDSRGARAICRAGAALQIDRLGRLQDSPAAALARRYQGLRVCAESHWRRLYC